MSKAAHIDIDYEKLRREKEQREKLIFCGENKYGYKISVQNAVISQLYEAFITRKKIHRPPSDRDRFLFETAVSVYICKVYKDVYKTELFFPVIGWQKERLEECVRCVDVPEAIETVMKLCEFNKVILKAEESYQNSRKEQP